METFQWIFDFAVISYIVWTSIWGSWVDQNISILYLRTDKKTKEIEKERQYRTQLNGRLKQVEHVLRCRNKVRPDKPDSAERSE